MKKLTEKLTELLSTSEMKFEEKESKTRFCFWTTEELSMSSLKKNLKEAGLEDFEKELKTLKKGELLETCLDDGWLHLTFKNELLDSEFLSKLDFD
jgi:hypothetical protein